MPLLSDKVAVKSHVAEQLGREWVTPLLCSGDKLPEHFRWNSPVVVKARHGCNQNAFIRLGAHDWEAARAASARWMRTRYGWWLDEWLYGEIPRGLLIEPFIGTVERLPLDYKIYVFGGQATHVQVHLEREHRHQWIIHDRCWRPLTSGAPLVRRPSALQAMLAAAEKLAAGFDFARVDFYQPDDQPLFGEISFYPGSGLDPFDPPALDEELGRLWLASAASVSVARLKKSAEPVLLTKPTFSSPRAARNGR